MTPFAGTNRVTSGYRLPGRADHNGIDVTNPFGAWRLREVTGGTVTRIWTQASRGLTLEVTTAAGDIERYQHLDETLVTFGQKVPQGTQIAVAGNTGHCIGGARADNGYMAGRHLHFEVLKGGQFLVNPAPWLGLPNKAGDYAGNDDLDGAAAADGAGNDGEEIAGGARNDGNRGLMLLKSFGVLNMQGFEAPNRNSAALYERMPPGYRLVTRRGVDAQDGSGWEYVAVLDERGGGVVYTPLLADRNELVCDLPVWVGAVGAGPGDAGELAERLEAEAARRARALAYVRQARAAGEEAARVLEGAQV